MEVPKGYITPNQWIPITPNPVPMRKTSNLREILERNAGVRNNHAQTGVLAFNGDELGQVPFRQLLEADDPAGGCFVNPYWVGAGDCARLGQTNRVESVISTQFNSNSNGVGDLNYLFTNQVDRFDALFNAISPANQVPLSCAEDMYTHYVPSNGLDTRYVCTQAGSLGQSNIESSQVCVNGPIQSILEPTPQYNSHTFFLPNLNSVPENIIPGTSAGNKMTVPSTPLNVEKFQRNINQNYMPLEIIDLESETTNNQINQHYLNQGESSQIITSQQKDIDKNVVVNGSEGHGENNATDLNSTPPPKTKRKKHRPKVVREGKPVRPPKGATPKPKDGNESTPRKRKYTRKNGVDAQATPATNVEEKVDNSPQTNNKRVRRSLKFDEPRSQEAVGNNVAGTKIREAGKTVHGFDLNVSLNQFGSQSVTFPQHPYQSQNLQHEAMERRKRDFARMMNGMTSSIDNRNDINGLTRTINDQGTKRDCYHVSNSLNESCNGLHKRRQTENALNTYSSRTSIQNGSNTESTFADIQRIMAFQNMQDMMANQMTSGVQTPNTVRCLNVSNNGTRVQASNLINDHSFSSPNTIDNQVRAPPNTMSYNKVTIITALTPNAVNCNKVSSTPTTGNEAPCLQKTSTCEKATEIHNDSDTNYEAHRPKAHVEALTANQVKSKTRTPRKKKSPRITSKPTNDKQMENIVLNTPSSSAKIPNINYKPSGVLITYKDPIDALARKLEQLNINDAVNSVMPNLETVLVPYANGGRALVLFENPLEFLKKKKKPRPKVDLDPESNRVWKLLMGLEDDEEKDVNKEKWWEDERRVFLGRAESFISRMKLIQGDRRFSPWKGSVVDSVVGVFLTQNVSDHLSSSAFMCLAARFPLRAKVDNRTTGLETASFPIIVLDEDYSNDELKKIGPDELNNSKKSQESNLDFNEIELGLGQKSPDGVLATSVILPSSTNEAEFHCIVSSPNSSESPKICSDCPDQAFNRNGLNSLSNFEATELLTGSRGNGYNSFTELLQMANDRVLSSNPQVPFNCQVDSSFHDSFLDSGFSENLCTKQVNSSKVNESTMHVDQVKRNSIIKSEVKEEISKKSAVNKSSKGDKAPKVEVKKRKSLETFDWDSLRRNVCKNHDKKMRRSEAMDSLDYEALRQADVDDISDAIRERGMNNMLAERMKAFLNRLVKDHGSIDLEWLRDVPPEKAKEYLLSIWGLGLKSVECVRLLTLHHLAFPVDTNVGRIAVRLGWVPLQPLPESLQLHLLEMYPMLETIQKYLWPRLCKLDQGTLYELHYHLITFGKVFCTKSKPNCNSCPMRGECKHFASAFASARLALPGPEEKRIVTSSTHLPSEKMSIPIPLPQLEPSMTPQILGPQILDTQIQNICRNNEPIIEEPASPEPESLESLENDIEDAFLYEDADEIPTIRLNIEEFTENLQEYMKANNMAIQDGDLSRALVTIDSGVASIPMPKLKNISRLRTEHLVYELPDSHPLLAGFDRREPDDPTKYLLAIWTPGETAQSIEAPKACSNPPESGKMCGMSTCFSCNSIREARTQTVRGTILIPCRTANRGSFPLNGTYFQTNEVFADHDSSCNPIDVPRDWIWKLERRTVYFGTSVTSIFRGLTTEAVQLCFRRGFVCVRGFDRETRSPKPLFARLHFTANKAIKTKKQDNGKSK